MEPDLVVIIAKQKAGYSDFWMWRHAKQRGRRTHAAQALYESHKHWAEEAREYVQSERKFNDRYGWPRSDE